jgi:hypothetical protein
MDNKEHILDMLKEKASRAVAISRRCLILQPGAVGDCILTLPLANFIKKQLKVGAVDMIARTDYTGYFPQRTCIDSLRSLDSVDTHRLFAPKTEFHLGDKDTLIELLAGYSYIVSFMGTPDSDFEQNLIFTVNCSNSAEVIILQQIHESPADHISTIHIRNFLDQYDIGTCDYEFSHDDQLINILHSDISSGREILNAHDIDEKKKLVVMHPGSGSTKKSWHLSNFISLADRFKKTDKQVVFLLGSAELERFSRAQLAAIEDIAAVISNASLNQVLQVLACSNCFIGNDSGITHMAAALGIKTIALFGPTDPQIYRPLGPDVTVIKDKTETFSQSPSGDLQQRVFELLKS